MTFTECCGRAYGERGLATHRGMRHRKPRPLDVERLAAAMRDAFDVEWPSDWGDDDFWFAARQTAAEYVRAES